MQHRRSLASRQAVKPYTDAEKAWLKKNYKDEYHFLQQNGLSIYKDEDREDGRALGRSLMAADDEVSADSEGVSDGNNEEEEEDDDADAFLAELDADPTSHVADYHFSEKQLIWIKKYRINWNTPPGVIFRGLHFQ
jgi:hypothetical protein